MRYGSHPVPTLFPYTTLFRSRQGRLAHPGQREGLMVATSETRRRGRVMLAAVAAVVVLTVAGVVIITDPFADWGGSGDRKSTRLNSSHRCISYAVFCLKKKIY